MARIDAVEVGNYRIVLVTSTTESTPATTTAFELISVRARDGDGTQGVSYTYTTGHNGAAIHATLRHAIADIVMAEDADRIEHLWNKVWWALHYGGRGGAAVLAQSALDIALHDLRAQRAKLPLWKMLGGHDPKVPCYADGIDLDINVAALLKQR